MAPKSAACSVRFLFLCLLVFHYRASANDDIVKERTLAMVKPDGVELNYTEDIKKIILAAGFSIAEEIQLELDEDTVKSFYAEHATKSFFSGLVRYMTSGPVFMMVLEKENAVADWRTLIGPTDVNKAKVTHPKSIRAMYGLSKEKNCVHGSDSLQSAAREIAFFFQKPLSGQDTKHDEL